MRKKIITIFITAFMITMLFSFSNIKSYAAVDPVDDLAYNFDDVSLSIKGIDITIDNSTQIWTINGTNTGMVVQADLFKLYQANTKGSVLDINKDYIVYYEYIGGTITGDDFTSRLLFNGDSVNSLTGHMFMETMQRKDLEISRAVQILPKGLYTVDSSFNLNFIGGSTTVANVDNYQFKLKIYEINKLSDFNFFKLDAYTETINGLTINITDGNRLKINGVTSTQDFKLDLSNQINDSVIISGNKYIVSYEYISGNLSMSTASGAYNLLYLSPGHNIRNDLARDTHKKSFGVVGLGSEILAMNLLLVPDSPRTITYDNLEVKYYIHEFEEQTTTPEPGDEAATINYYLEGVIDSTVESTVGGTLTAPEIPVKVDHTFIGWYLEDTFETIFNFSADKVTTAEFNLYARFVSDTETVYVVTFDTNEGSLIDPQNIVNGEVVTKPTNPARAGYTFNGWYSDETLTTAYNFQTLVDADVTLYAKWTVSTGTTTPPASSLTATHWVIISLSVAVVGVLIYKGTKK